MLDQINILNTEIYIYIYIYDIYMIVLLSACILHNHVW